MSDVESFLSTLKSNYTQRNYRSCLRHWTTWLNGRDPTAALAVEWVNLQRDKVGVGTLNIYVCALRKYLRHLGQAPDGLSLSSYRAPRQPVMPWNSRQEFITAGRTEVERAFLTLLVYSGCRWEGLSNLLWGGVHAQECEIETVEKRGIRRTRDSKMGPVLINQKCVDAITAYQATLKTPPNPDENVFQFSYRTALRLVKRAAKEAQIPLHVKGLHSVRRGFATNQMNKLRAMKPEEVVVGLDAIRRSMSQTNLQTLNEYLYVDREKSRQAYDELVGEE